LPGNAATRFARTLLTAVLLALGCFAQGALAENPAEGVPPTRELTDEILARGEAGGGLAVLLGCADSAGLRTLSLSALGDRVFYHSGQAVHCVDLRTEQPLWSKAAPPLRGDA
jgi:hypothetical protein